jgi:WD40 repeat protein
VSPTEDFHKYYVTALCFYERESDKAKILVSGDAGGDIIASEIFYDKQSGKIDKIVPFFKKRAHDGWITNIKRYRNLDIVVTSSHDTCVSFWEVEKKRKLMTLTEHEKPIQSIQFCHAYEYMVTATDEDLVIWKLKCQEGADYEEVPEDTDEDDLPSRYTISAT